MQSRTAPTGNNVVLKITVPKRTGVKRKRKSDVVFEATSLDGETSIEETQKHTQDLGSGNGFFKRPGESDAEYMRKSMADNRGVVGIQSVGYVKRTHRYRGRLLSHLFLLTN
jgi:Tau95 Triple barrel domain